MRLHYLIGRLSSPLQLAFFALYNRMVHVPRARVLVWNEHDELLLVRNWGGKQQWGLPGGGVERNESPEAAAKRELYEEVGVDVAIGSLTYIATIHYQYEAVIYATRIRKDAVPAKPHNPWEITDLQWFSIKNLPADLSPLVSLALKKLSKTE
jgi:8-oxo-dGTP diphosphatase